MIAAELLIVLGAYLASGLLFALAFIILGAQKMDPHAAHGSWGFRLLIIPGVVTFWPLLLHRWLKGVSKPPQELNAHRQCAGTDPSSTASHHVA